MDATVAFPFGGCALLCHRGILPRQSRLKLKSQGIVVQKTRAVAENDDASVTLQMEQWPGGVQAVEQEQGPRDFPPHIFLY